jgi:hypothetical protein
VGQVEGLGTVIISIIKDMVVPIENRPHLTKRAHTGPFSAYTTGGSASSTNVPLVGPTPHSSHSVPTLSSRPELVHSTQSFYHPRGPHSNHGPGLSIGGVSTASSRTSAEAMRVILASSNAAATGNAGDNFSSTVHPTPGSNSTHNGMAIPLKTSQFYNSSEQPHQQNQQHQPGQPAPQSNAAATLPLTPARWQYRCILRQKDVDSLRITLPEPEPSSPLNNLTRRAGKPQWKAILQSIHPAITQQVASKLKKVQNNQHFEKELAKFDETMLRFNYKFGVLLVLPGQVKEEDWFSNQMADSTRFSEFLESGALGQKVALKGFERFSAGLDTRSMYFCHFAFLTFLDVGKNEC